MGKNQRRILQDKVNPVDFSSFEGFGFWDGYSKSFRRNWKLSSHWGTFICSRPLRINYQQIHNDLLEFGRLILENWWRKEKFQGNIKLLYIWSGRHHKACIQKVQEDDFVDAQKYMQK